jgi:dihydropyrimidinase
MSKSSSDEVLRAKLRGNLVFSETLAASLGISGEGLWDKDWNTASRYVMSPPISPDPTTKTHLMKMINSHVIDVVGTDNCTFCTEQKQLGRQDFRKIPNGVNGIEDRLSIVWTKGVRTGLISENDFVRSTSTQAARLFNMYPNKGVIRKGADADVVVWNPEANKVISKDNHSQNIDYNIF